MLFCSLFIFESSLGSWLLLRTGDGIVEGGFVLDANFFVFSFFATSPTSMDGFNVQILSLRYSHYDKLRPTSKFASTISHLDKR